MNHKATSLEELQQYVDDRFSENEVRVALRLTEIEENFSSAFPEGDLAGHNRFHQRSINAAKAEEEFWRTAKTEVVKHGVSAVFTVIKGIAILVVLGIAYKVGAGPVVSKFMGW